MQRNYPRLLVIMLLLLLLLLAWWLLLLLLRCWSLVVLSRLPYVEAGCLVQSIISALRLHRVDQAWEAGPGSELLMVTGWQIHPRRIVGFSHGTVENQGAGTFWR